MLTPDVNPIRPLTNQAGLTFCLFTPALLAVLTLFHPTVNLPVLRILAAIYFHKFLFISLASVDIG